MTTTIDKPIHWEAWGGTPTPSAYVMFWDRELTQPYTLRSASISSSISTALDFLLSKDISIEDRVAVEGFLALRYGVVAHLYEVQGKVSQYFGKATPKLGLFSDPDSSDGQAELYLEVETTLSPKEANEKLAIINREWILSSGDKDLMSLNITLRFV